MKILVSNDDGIFSTGLRALANALAQAGHEVIVVCPDRERSATGHGLTMHKPIRVEEVTAGFEASVRAWACSGLPADCVKLALDAILDGPPDWVISGINHGANLGTDVLYSGTVSAAMEGVLEGISSLAVSLASFSYQDFQPAAKVACSLVEQLSQRPIELPVLLNVNVPPVAAADIQGIRVARLGVRRYFDLFEKRVDPRGRTYYWLAGEVLEESDAKPTSFSTGTVKSLLPQALCEQFPTDTQAIRDNWITLTPLQYDLTVYAGLSYLKEALIPR
ncbi:MAG: 5'/3'-nucleotidase SurE [Leptolyngbya sp. SIO4C1]|nr:5'/3'-nucleotidase SurE [Leptolyngbya sp. SIO4C1]